MDAAATARLTRWGRSVRSQGLQGKTCRVVTRLHGTPTAWLGASYEVKSFRRVEQSGSVAAPPRRGLGLWYT